MMTKTFLNGALALVTTWMLAVPADAAVIEATRFKGSQVATSFSATATIACAGGGTGTATASGFLSGSASISKSTGAPRTMNNGIFVEIDAYSNGCTGASIGFADGAIANGFDPPNRRLASAALEGTTTVQDFDTGASVLVTLDIDVDGTGPIDRSSSSTRTRTVPTSSGPITITITHSASSSREGVASGTITIDGVGFTPTFSSTTMSFSKNSEIDIER